MSAQRIQSRDRIEPGAFDRHRDRESLSPRRHARKAPPADGAVGLILHEPACGAEGRGQCRVDGPGAVVSPPAPAAVKPLAEFDAYGSEARKAALDHFGKSIEEIESILGKSSPDEGLRDDLAWALWKYARGKANQDGSSPELPLQVRRYIESLDVAVRPLRDVLAKLKVARARDDAAAHTVAIMLDAAGVDLGAFGIDLDTAGIEFDATGMDASKFLGQLEAILSVTENASKSKGGRPPDVEYHLLMYRVSCIFQQTTKRRATLTTDRHNNRYSGDFFKFAELVDAAATQQPPKTNSALGELLKLYIAIPEGAKPGLTCRWFYRVIGHSLEFASFR